MGLDNFLVVGDVYRRDAIDASHYPAFHQVGILTSCYLESSIESILDIIMLVVGCFDWSLLPTLCLKYS